MVEAIHANSQSQECAPQELFQEIPYIQELLPQSAEAIIALQHEIQQKLTELLTQAMDNPCAWHQATQLVQVAGTKFGYLVPKEFPHLTNDALASLKEVHETFRKESMGVDLPREVPFTYLEGEGKEGMEKSVLSSFNANFLCMPDDYTWFFGGCSRWEIRVDELCETILIEHPDIVCLQEIHDVECSDTLYEKLQESYAHFYINIGQGDYTKDPEKIMMNSGLFVASKYPIKDPTFVPYRQEGRQWQINKGFFHGTVMIGGKAFCHLYTSHLNPYNDEMAERVRKEQAEEIVSSMKKTQAVAPIPAFLLGDLNVNKYSSEWNNSPLSKEFIHRYPCNQETATDTLNNIVYSAKNERGDIAEKGHICDYALMYNSCPGTIDTRVVPLYHLDEPEKASSDHQGIFSTIRKELTD